MAIINVNEILRSDREGGYTAGPPETYCGIDRVQNPSWSGWKIIDDHKRTKGAIPYNTILHYPALDAAVKSFYQNYITPLVPVSNINNQKVADFLVDFMVHKKYDAVKVANATARALAPSAPTKATALTPQVVTIINQQPADFYKKLYNNRIAYYQQPGLFGSVYSFSQKFINAFINRVHTFPATIPATTTSNNTSGGFWGWLFGW